MVAAFWQMFLNQHGVDVRLQKQHCMRVESSLLKNFVCLFIVTIANLPRLKVVLTRHRWI